MTLEHLDTPLHVRVAHILEKEKQLVLNFPNVSDYNKFAAVAKQCGATVLIPKPKNSSPLFAMSEPESISTYSSDSEGTIETLSMKN